MATNMLWVEPFLAHSRQKTAGQSSSLAGAPLANKLVNKRPHGENYRCWRHLRQLITISQILAMAPSFNNLTEDDGNDSEEEIDVSGS